MVVLVTGARGFLGSALVRRLQLEGKTVRMSTHRAVRDNSTDGCDLVVKEVGPQTDWQSALTNVDTVIHSAARVHQMNDSEGDALAAFRAVNAQGTANLARQAAANGTRRFIFISSVKVNGEATQQGYPYGRDSLPSPRDPYGVSKLEAETELRRIGASGDMEWVTLRSPLMYGPGVKANFRAMMSWLWKGLPLPFGSVKNLRSFVALDNMVDLVVRCIDQPAAANRLFFVSDDEDLSTPDLLTRLGAALGRPVRLLGVPVPFLYGLAAAVGRKEEMRRLCSSLQVDISDTAKSLGWRPPITVNEGLEIAAKSWCASHRRS